ncbi:hypothetical protein [Halocalculus aciditolerans]|uniref:C2H2-type domain-containing protein n=1 Tax=Halocalculus aciditolerans TaxID=1383812 RepID=A0A830FB77_9EURY|nr:hypothetical protein [Halocalculus aciditolerans]GGL57839.1 hypothetical protein GCM10009039_15010 [Halocalculus aciditolerans]
MSDIECRYGGLLLQMCREAIEKDPNPSEDELRHLVGWVVVESGFRANPSAARDCLSELADCEVAGGEDDHRYQCPVCHSVYDTRGDAEDHVEGEPGVSPDSVVVL